MPTVEYGYLGTTSVESSASRLPTMDAFGNPVYTPFNETAWANELIGTDGRFRFMKSTRATGRGVGNALDDILADNFTILCLCRAENNNVFVSALAKGLYGGSEWFGLYPHGGVNRGPTFSIKHGVPDGAQPTLPGIRKPASWQWVVGSRLGGQTTVWGDGKKLSNNDSNAGSIYNTSALSIDANAYRVNIACVVIYSRILSDSETVDLMAGRVSPKSLGGLAAYYKFNEVAGYVCKDHSGNGHDLAYYSEYSGNNEEWSPDGNLAKSIAAANLSWYVPAGCSLSDTGFTFTGAASSGSSFMCNADVINGQAYKVTYDVSGVTGGGGVRVLLFGNSGGASASTNLQYSDATGVTQTIKVVGSGAGTLNRVGVQMVGTGTAFVSNVRVIPVIENSTGKSGQPYVTRGRRNLANWWEVPTPRVANPAQMCSLLTGVAGGTGVLDTGPGDLTRIGASDMSIAGWIKPLGISTRDAGSWTLLHRSGTSEFRFDIDTFGAGLTLTRANIGAGVSLARPIPMNKWVHVAVVHKYFENTAYFYINAVLVGVRPLAGAPGTFVSSIGIGSISSKRAAQVRSIRLLSRALTSDEVSRLYYLDTLESRETTTLLGEWLCNDMSITTLKDSSGNGRHSTPVTGTAGIMVADSPYTVTRRKRQGKQLAVPGWSCIFTNNIGQYVHGKSQLTLSGWVKSALGNINFNRLSVNAQSIGNRQILCFNQSVNKTAQPVANRSPWTDTSSSYGFTTTSTVGGDTEWHYYAVDYDCESRTCRLFLDGVLILTSFMGTASVGSTFDMTNDGTNVTSQFRMLNPNTGALANSYAAYDDVRLHSRLMTLDEHYRMFLGSVPRDNLVVEYLFDNDVDKCLDTSGNNLHGAWSSLSLANYVKQP